MSITRSETIKNDLRNGRTTLGSLDNLGSSNLQFFLGLYNSEPFTSNVRDTVKSLKEAGYQVLLVDNASKDGTWEFIESLVSEHPGYVLGIQNPFNVGATGSFLLNADLYMTPWIGFLCQDDVYFENHGPCLERLVSEANHEVVGVAASMDRITRGGDLSFFPRLGDMDIPIRSPDQAAALIRNHFFPMPAAALRVCHLENVSVSYHDTSFPDTEMLLALLQSGVLVTTTERTMAYLENSESESHAIGRAYRARGQSLGLTRFFSSASFAEMLMSIPLEDRDKFVAHLLESVHIRLGDTETSEMVKHFLCDTVARQTGYSSNVANSWLQNHYRHQGSPFSVDFFDRNPRAIDNAPANLERVHSQEFERRNYRLSKSQHMLMARLSGVLLRFLARFGRDDLDLKFRRR